MLVAFLFSFLSVSNVSDFVSCVALYSVTSISAADFGEIKIFIAPQTSLS